MNAVADAPAAPAPVSRFVDNGDGTITDTASGLMWSKATLSDKCVTHAKAEKTCAELTLAGHTDWRLPTAEELFLLSDRSRRDPAIDTEAFPDTKSDWYWSGTIATGYPDYAWIVSFDNGNSNGNLRGNLNAFVRAVRAVPSGQ